MAKTNPFRFSTKYQDEETDMLYYGYRYYNGSTGRWISRDPINEFGFQPYASTEDWFDLDEKSHDYGFVENCAVLYWDELGLKCGCTITLNVSPPDRKAFHNNVLNVVIDQGHTWLVLTQENESTMTWSFGPGARIGKGNADIFRRGHLPGNANWRTDGDFIGATRTWELDHTQCTNAMAIITRLKASVPNYTPTYQCTSSALDVLRQVSVSPPPPPGIGPVVAKTYYITFWKGYVANPYHLAFQMGWTGGSGGGKKGVR